MVPDLDIRPIVISVFDVEGPSLDIEPSVIRGIIPKGARLGYLTIRDSGHYC